MFHGNLCSFNFPSVRFRTDTEHCGLVTFRCRIEKVKDEAISIEGVVVNELCQGVEPVLCCHIHLGIEGVYSSYLYTCSSLKDMVGRL